VRHVEPQSLANSCAEEPSSGVFAILLFRSLQSGGGRNRDDDIIGCSARHAIEAVNRGFAVAIDVK
jgi:hypothetical protein